MDKGSAFVPVVDILPDGVKERIASQDIETLQESVNGMLTTPQYELACKVIREAIKNLLIEVKELERLNHRARSTRIKSTLRALRVALHAIQIPTE